MTGRIKTINRERGFGFITADEDGKDLFFHRSDLARVDGIGFEDLDEDAPVAFEAVVPTPPKGPRARSVTAVGAGTA